MLLRVDYRPSHLMASLREPMVLAKVIGTCPAALSDDVNLTEIIATSSPASAIPYAKLLKGAACPVMPQGRTRTQKPQIMRHKYFLSTYMQLIQGMIM